jgi:hypothetical protein
MHPNQKLVTPQQFKLMKGSELVWRTSSWNGTMLMKIALNCDDEEWRLQPEKSAATHISSLII